MATEQTSFWPWGGGLDVTAAILDAFGDCRAALISIDKAWSSRDDLLETCGSLPRSCEGGERVDTANVCDCN